MAQVMISLEFMSQRRFLDVLKVLKSADYILIGLLLFSIVPCVSMEGDGSTHKPDDETSMRNRIETWEHVDIQAQHLKSFQDILQILETMNMFKHNGNVSNCFVLDRVMREISSSSKFPRKIGIHFYFEESAIDSGDTVFLDKNTVAGNFLNTNRNLKTENCYKSPTISDIHVLDRLSRKQGDNNQKNASDNTSNKTMTDASGAQQMGDGTTSQHDKSRGLSRTQVVVIATCSAVIGTFFIIAGAIRIHNCMRRYRANREAALVNARRTSAFGFGGSVNIRRDSASSKASRQQSHPASKAGSDTQVDRNGRSQHPNSHNSPQHSSDHNPLLPVRLVGQFSDGSSSHGSLAYIDEESHSKSKQNDNYSGSDLGSEDDPLLRKSPDSGSSIDIGLEDNGKDDVPEEHIKSSFSSDTHGRNDESPKRVLKSPDRTVVFEPGGDTGSESNQDPRQDELINDNITELHTDNDRLAFKPDEEKTNDSDGLNKVESKLGESQDSEKDLSTNISPMKKNKLPLKQFSVDYFDVDDNGFEIQNPIFEEINDSEPYGHLSENHAVTTGLSQSDSSLSNNPSYCYGNQTEYDNYGGYGQIGYSCPYYIKPGNDIYWLDTDFIQNSLRNSELLSAENLRRENGDLLSESFDETYLAGSTRKSSLAEECNKTKYPRMYSTDSYFSNPVNKLTPLERSHSASPDDVSDTSTVNTESTSRTRDLHIVPLEEYHRNSIKEMSDEEDAV